MRKQKKRKFNFKKMAIALVFILCNCFLINAMAEPYSQIKVTTSGKFTENEIKREKTVRIIQKAAYKNRQHDFFRLPALICLSHQRRFSCFCL